MPHSTHIVTRRDFLTRGLGLVGVSAALPNFLMRTAWAEDKPASDRIMVVLQLSGGNDTLSTLVPYGHEAYGRNRKVTRIEDSEVIKINSELGLHPNLKGFKELLDQGAFAAIPGIGYPNPNYSHFTATDIWHTADRKGRGVRYGWIGRACDVAFKDNRDARLALAVGSGQAPLAIEGEAHPGLSFHRPDSFRYTGDKGDKARGELYRKVNDLQPATPADTLSFVTQTAINANACSEEVRRLAGDYKPPIEYPKTELGNSLKTIAGLICGGLSTRIYYTFHGGYDTHSTQKTNHGNLMKQLNDAVFAFQQDLAKQGQAKRVLLFTISEFGRRISENGSEGTDHGAGGSVFLFGPGIKAGIHGKHPSLTDLEGGGGGSLKFSVDFRSVYATVLEKWMGIPSEPVLGKYPLLDFVA
ncbi:MAG: DUF1501 domain-containing protein [Verrucomicrobiota bacterium]